MPKKSSKKKEPDNRKISKDKSETLKDLFFMGGISPAEAARQADVNYLTARAYFTEWAEELIDDPAHESWAQREKRERARALESVTKSIIKVQKRADYFQSLLEDLITVKKGKTRIPRADFDESEDRRVDQYERIVRNTDILLNDLQTQYAVLAMSPPLEAIIEAEVEKVLATSKQTV